MAELQLMTLEASDLEQFKRDMQEAFQKGAEEGGYPLEDDLILPESHIDASLQKKGAVAYKLDVDGQMLGGAIVVVDEAGRKGELDFLYIKHGVQGKGFGKFIWFELEKYHPDIQIWQTATPHFETRNIHFYINVCGFHAVEYFHAGYPMPDMAEEEADEDDTGMFLFRKQLLKEG